MNSSDAPASSDPQTAPPKPSAIRAGTSEQFERARERLAPDFEAMESNRLLHVLDTMLKRPGRVVYTLVNDSGAGIPLSLLAILMVCLAATGLMMGGFSGGAQLIAVPLKVIAGTLMAGIICLPSLYILLCLCGGRQNFLQTARMLLLGLALCGILLIGFIPVAWIFSQATDSLAFMGTLYLAVWSIGLFFGLRLMRNAFQFLNRRSMGALILWMLIFFMVLLQMSTTLRPLLGEYETLNLSEKMFFLEHWAMP